MLEQRHGLALGAATGPEPPCTICYTWRMLKQCVRCSEWKEETKFRPSFGGSRKNTCWACKGKYERITLKLKMFEALGRKCNCCGEEHPDLLTLDHVNNDGHIYRERYNEQQMYRMAHREGWPKDKYQVLCMSCNFAKGHFGECPHKTGKTAEQRYNEMLEIAAWKGQRFRKKRG